MATDPVQQQQASPDTTRVSGALTDRLIELLEMINSIGGFSGLGVQESAFGVDTDGDGIPDDLSGALFSKSTIAPDAFDSEGNLMPGWVESQTVLFQSFSQRLQEIKQEVTNNTGGIQNDFINQIDKLFAAAQTKAQYLDSLENMLDPSSDYDTFMLQAAALENSFDINDMASDLIDSFLDLIDNFDADRINNDLFSFIRTIGNKFSQTLDADGNPIDSTDASQAKFFVNAAKRNLSNPDIFEKVKDEIIEQYGGIDEYLQKMIEIGQIKLPQTIINKIQRDYELNAYQKDKFLTADYMKLLGNSPEETLSSLTAMYQEIYPDNIDDPIDKIYTHHIRNFTSPAQLVSVNNIGELIKLKMQNFEIQVVDDDQIWNGTSMDVDGVDVSVDFDRLKSFMVTLFYNSSLKFNKDFGSFILEQLGISEADQKNIKSQSDLTSILTAKGGVNAFSTLLGFASEFYGGDENDALLNMFKDYSVIDTPRYYEDHRSLYDLLSGKSSALDDGSNVSGIFDSIETQLQNVSQSLIDLLSNGYDKPAKNNIQQYIRNNPSEVMIFLEGQRGSLSGEELKQVDDILTALQGRLVRQITSQAEYYQRKIDALNKGEEVNTGISLEEYQEKLESLKTIINQAKSYRIGDSETIQELQTALEEHIEIDSIPTSFTVQTVLSEIDDVTSIMNINNMLYALEDTIASKRNAEYGGRKLPEPKQDGEIPEDTTPIPPQIGPSITSVIIAAIGREMINKADSIKDNAKPGTNWINQESSLLSNIESKLTDGFTAGDNFMEALKNAFKPAMKYFMEYNSLSKKTASDSAKLNLQSVHGQLVAAQAVLTAAENENPPDPGKIALAQAEVERLTAEEDSAKLFYKTSLVDYSNEISTFSSNEQSSITDVFSKLIKGNGAVTLNESGSQIGSMDVSVDSDGNGINDFQDMLDFANKLHGNSSDPNKPSLSSMIQNIFIDPATDPTKGVNAQNIRRLLMMSFFFSLIEPGEWDSLQSDANVDRYAVSI